MAVVVTGRKGGAEEEPTGREGGRWAAVARQREEGLLFGAAGIERRLEVVWQGRLGGLNSAVVVCGSGGYGIAESIIAAEVVPLD